MGACQSNQSNCQSNSVLYLCSNVNSQPPPSQQGAGSVGGASAMGGSLRPDSSEKKDTLPPMMRVIARLWCHECTRVFGDRIINEDGEFF